jgi:hypothetical protein
MIMTRLLAILATALCLSACTSTSDTLDPSVTPAAKASQPQPVENLPAKTGEATGLDSIEPPAVKPTAIPVAASGESPTDRICHREMRTGSHRAVRVCRTRAEIARLEEESKDTFRELHRSQTHEK